MAIASFAQIEEHVKWTYSVKELKGSEAELVFTGKIDDGWHLYSQHTDPAGPIATSFEFTPSKDYKLKGKVQETKPHEEYDDIFKCTVRSFSDKVVFRQKIERFSDKDFEVKGVFSYQMCNQGSCVAPEDRDFAFSVKGARLGPNTDSVNYLDDGGAMFPDADTPEEMQEGEPVVDTAVAAVAETEEAPAEKKNQSLIVVFLLALLGGILTMFTPCVFPMIPMTVNFFMHNSDDPRKSRRQAWMFGFSIVFLFSSKTR